MTATILWGYLLFASFIWLALRLRAQAESLRINDGFVKWLTSFYHDLFEVHCPWSWRVARKHRIADLRKDLAEYGCRTHNVLGHINAADCDQPDLQGAIARYCYESRTRFWGRELLHLIFAPVIFVALLAIGIALAVAATYQEVRGFY